MGHEELSGALSLIQGQEDFLAVMFGYLLLPQMKGFWYSAQYLQVNMYFEAPDSCLFRGLAAASQPLSGESRSSLIL